MHVSYMTGLKVKARQSDSATLLMGPLEEPGTQGPEKLSFGCCPGQRTAGYKGVKLT